MRAQIANAVDEMVSEIQATKPISMEAYICTRYKAMKSVWIQDGRSEEEFEAWWRGLELSKTPPEDCL